MQIDCHCDYEPWDFYSNRVVKARKQHKCYECRMPIVPGDRYEYVTGKCDGAIDTFRTCGKCVDLRTWVQNNVPCLCWAHGNLFSDLRDAVEDANDRAPQETVGLRFGLLRRSYYAYRQGK
jgi:hypothetical protein